MAQEGRLQWTEESGEEQMGVVGRAADGLARLAYDSTTPPVVSFSESPPPPPPLLVLRSAAAEEAPTILTH